MPEEPAYDAVVSHRRQEPDKTWVRQTTGPTLGRTGPRVCVDHRTLRIVPWLRLGSAPSSNRLRVPATARVTTSAFGVGFRGHGVRCEARLEHPPPDPEGPRR